MRFTFVFSCVSFLASPSLFNTCGFWSLLHFSRCFSSVFYSGGGTILTGAFMSSSATVCCLDTYVSFAVVVLFFLPLIGCVTFVCLTLTVVVVVYHSLLFFLLA